MRLYKGFRPITSSRRLRGRRGVAQPGSAPHWGCGGRRFESGRPDHFLRELSPGMADAVRAGALEFSWPLKLDGSAASVG